MRTQFTGRSGLRTALLAALAAGSLVLAACSSDPTPEKSAEPATSAAATPADATPSETAETSASPSGDSAPEAALTGLTFKGKELSVASKEESAAIFSGSNGAATQVTVEPESCQALVNERLTEAAGRDTSSWQIASAQVKEDNLAVVITDSAKESWSSEISARFKDDCEDMTWKIGNEEIEVHSGGFDTPADDHYGQVQRIKQGDQEVFLHQLFATKGDYIVMVQLADSAQVDEATAREMESLINTIIERL